MTFSEKGYNSLIESIFLRFPSVGKASFSSAAYKPGLAHMEDFSAALGHPERSMRIIHVAGTNGKGSVCNMLASVLSSTGLRTGLYTSPHILDFRERMRLADTDGSWMVPKEYVYRFLTEWMPYAQEHDLSFFEITTGMAFKWFADSGAEAAVIETGLGGRLDSTNIVTPALSIITSIGLDHCALLGDTLPEIAAEKAGIIKPGIPVVISETLPETAPVFTQAASGKLIFADRTEPPMCRHLPHLIREADLRGACQEANLRTVLCAMDLIRTIPGFESTEAREEVILSALVHTAARMEFHGRWEKISDAPLMICDIGHNAAALSYNFAQLRRGLYSGEWSSLIIVYGIMADKDLDAILPLMPREARYIFTAPDTQRALPAGVLLARYLAFSKEHSGGTTPCKAIAVPSVQEAVAEAVKLCRDPNGSEGPKPLIYIGGSTFVVAEALPPR